MEDFNTNNMDNGFSSEPVNEVAADAVNELATAPDQPANDFNTDFTQSNDYVQPDAVYNQFDANQSKGGNGMAIAAMVLGIVSIVVGCCCTPIGAICGILGIIFGILVKKKGSEGGSQALAGIICGAIGTAISIVNAILGAAMGDSFQSYMEKAAEVSAIFMNMM